MENINIIEERENPLFKRKEVKFSIDAEVTPSHADARKIISENFSTPEENIRIKNILGKFGSKTFTISANIYASEQDKLDTEGKSKKDGAAKSEEPAPVQETPTQDTTTPAPSKSEELINKPNESNEPASEQSEEPKPEEKTE